MLPHPRWLPWVTRSFLSGLLLLSSIVAAHAQELWTHNGAAVCTLPTCGGADPLIQPDGSGGAVIAWRFFLDFTTGQDISAHRIQANGSLYPGWPQALGGPPITRAPGNQWMGDIVPDGTGGAFIVWIDYRNVFSTDVDIYAQHVLGNGQIAPGWPVDGLPISTAPAFEDYPDLVPNSAGGVFIFWVRNGDTIVGQHLNADGSRVDGWPAAGLIVREVAGSDCVRPLGVPDGEGGCIVVWGDGRSIDTDLYAHRIHPGGSLDADWPTNGRLVVPGPGNLLRHSVTDGVGGAYVTFARTLDPGSLDDDVYATRVLSDGSVAPGWPADGLAVAVYPGWQAPTSAAADSTGGLLLAWQDSRVNPAQAYVQRLRADGTLPAGWQPGGNPVSNLPGYQAVPQITPDGHGGGFVAFEEAFNSQGYVQRVTPAGAIAPGWPTTGLPLVDLPSSSTNQESIVITSDGVGGAIVVWDDFRNGTASQLYAQRYSGSGPTAALTALVRFEAIPDRVTLLWAKGDDTHGEVRIERGSPSSGWTVLGQRSFDGEGRLEYEDRSVQAGGQYYYRLAWTFDGRDRATTEVLVDVPRGLTLVLEGLRPNPAVGDINVAFTLPTAAPATIEMIDLAGRRVAVEDVGSLGPGRHVVRLAPHQRRGPGVYWLNLRQGEQTLRTRAVVMR